MNILERIATYKKREVAFRKQAMPIDRLELMPLFSRVSSSMKDSLGTKPLGIIAEHKRRSPSKESINYNLDLGEVVRGYQLAGAAGVSVLTDTPYFGGSLNDLLEARSVTELPLLRKDFTVDSYQIYEAKAFGADCILLIAAILNDDQLKQFTALAQSIGLEVLLEVHDQRELDHALKTEANIIGVNNRNLKTFEVSLSHSAQLAKSIPAERCKISESGIHSMEDVSYLKRHGFEGFLIGERFMKENDPGAALTNFINKL